MGSRLPPKRGTAPQFSVYVYCGQTAGWMKTPLGTEVDLGPAHIVLDGVPAPRKRGTCLLWPRSPMSFTAEHSLKVLKRSGKMLFLAVLQMMAVADDGCSRVRH